jgi:hypothetical protein
MDRALHHCAHTENNVGEQCRSIAVTGRQQRCLVFFDLPSALDYRLELQRAGEAAERAYQRRFKRELDPLNWGHWN